MVELLIVFALWSASALANEAPADIQIPVLIRSSPEEQVQLSEDLLSEAYAAADERKIEGVLKVLAHLDVVHKRWPKATSARLIAATMQADVALEFNLPRNALDALDQAASIAKGFATRGIVRSETWCCVRPTWRSTRGGKTLAGRATQPLVFKAPSPGRALDFASARRSRFTGSAAQGCGWFLSRALFSAGTVFYGAGKCSARVR